jgi:hypothetical protein
VRNSLLAFVESIPVHLETSGIIAADVCTFVPIVFRLSSIPPALAIGVVVLADLVTALLEGEGTAVAANLQAEFAA